MRDPIGDIIRREGSAYTNHPEDRGGPTRYGVTQATLSAWRKRQVTPDEVAALTEAEARAIYADVFMVQPRFAEILDDRLRGLVVDCGVNHGPKTAAKFLQRAAGVKDDGVIGPATLAAVNGVDPAPLYWRVLAQRVKHYGRLITDDPSQAKFAAGWMNRAAEFMEVWA